MDIATGAMNTLLPKLTDLVVGEYKLQKGVKGEIKKLEEELTRMTAALRKVAEVPLEQLDELVKIWAGDVRELSYDIEDSVDTFMLRSKEVGHTELFSLKGLFGKATDLYKKAKTNHQIHNVIKDIMDHVKEVAERRDRYKVDNITASQAMASVDPRLQGMYRKATELVGMGKPKNDLARRLLQQDSSSSKKLDIISIVGFGGLGKTTLANSLLQDHKSNFDCHFFVTISFNPDIKRIFKNILLQLDEKKHGPIDETWEIKLLIDKIIEFLKNRRCLCVIDDLWSELPWDTIKLALQDGAHGSKIIITTRNKAVAEYVGGGVYELKPLSNADSRELFYKRIFDSENDCPANFREVTEKILKKCGGVPLAIISIASLLVSKPFHLVEWDKVNNSIGSGLEKSHDVDKMKKILCLSYNDLPLHLKTCLLSLSKYPEDHVIRKDVLVWSWIAEGFITPTGRSSLEEIGDGYFVELINRSLIQPVNYKNPFYVLGEREVYACQLHDMLHELIVKLSAAEGLVTTTLSDGEGAGASTVHQIQRETIRRLCIHDSSKSNSTSINERNQLLKVRSLDVFGGADLMPAMSRFRVLRVLQLENCSDLDSNHLKDLSNLHLLRFLRLQGLRVTELPESMGELESLETLDIRGNRSVITLPPSFVKLRKLARLLATMVELPDSLKLGKMESLQEAVGIYPTLHAMNEIGKLKELKVLELHTDMHGGGSKNSSKLILKCIKMCPSSLKVLVLSTPLFLFCSLDSMAQAVSSGLQTFMCSTYFNSFPRWINQSLSCLTVLSIRLNRVLILQHEHFDTLAGLPSLRFLRLHALYPQDEQETLVAQNSASAFPCLTDLRIECVIMFLKFQHGAMRKLQNLCLKFSAIVTNKHYGTSNFDYGFENLPSLKHAVISIVQKCPEAKDAIMQAFEDHHNHPSLDFSFTRQ